MIVIILGATGATGAGCGAGGGAPGSAPSPGEPTPVASARADLAARAAAARDLTGISVYALDRPDGVDGPVMVVRAADGAWRVDVPGGALGGTVDVAIAATAGSQFQCALPPREPGCVRVDRLTLDLDPRVQHVFTDWPDVFTDRAAPLAVAAAPPLPEVGGECYSVEPSTASLVPPVDAGVYCYQPDGILTGARLALGTLTLVSTDPAAPALVELPGPVVATDPLPTTAPPPSPSPPPSPPTSPAPA